MVEIHLREMLWVYCPGHAGVKGNDRAAGLAGKARATLTSGLLLGRSEVLRSLRHYLLSQSQGHHTIDRLEERGVESKEEALDYTFLERTREGHRQSDEHWNRFKDDTGKLLREGVERIMVGFFQHTDTVLTRSEEL